MALELNGTTGVSLVQDGVITDANLPAGSVLQVVSSTKTNEFTTSSVDTFVDIGLEATITPTSASSNIFVHVELSVGGDNNYYAEFKVLKNGTSLVQYNGSGSGTSGFMGTNSVNDYAQFYLQSCSGSYLDTNGSVSALTYKVQAARLGDSTGNVYINRTFDTANSTRCTGISTITLMEIAG